ncbi:hypothetical protein Q0M94_03440 [Deinococcus radiomollis]|uniref:hypothetical protein n=1 Tax=Deinococcus radiomollis TaxID=468916 RepID=UPI0038929DF8
MATKFPLVNGFRYSFASIELNIKAKRIPVFKSINYSSDKAPGEVRGNHAQLVGRTRGDLKDTCSLELYEEEFNDVIVALGNGFMDQTFDIVVSYAEEGQKTITDKIFGCIFSKVDKSHTQGVDGLIVKIDLHVMRIDLNGKTPLKKML